MREASLLSVQGHHTIVDVVQAHWHGLAVIMHTIDMSSQICWRAHARRAASLCAGLAVWAGCCGMRWTRRNLRWTRTTWTTASGTATRTSDARRRRWRPQPRLPAPTQVCCPSRSHKGPPCCTVERVLCERLSAIANEGEQRQLFNCRQGSQSCCRQHRPRSATCVAWQHGCHAALCTTLLHMKSVPHVCDSTKFG